jgi:hypothetical protein
MTNEQAEDRLQGRARTLLRRRDTGADGSVRGCEVSACVADGTSNDPRSQL